MSSKFKQKEKRKGVKYSHFTSLIVHTYHQSCTGKQRSGKTTRQGNLGILCGLSVALLAGSELRNKDRNLDLDIALVVIIVNLWLC